MPGGIPKTEAEREETHQALYGESAPMNRGNKIISQKLGSTREEHMANVQYLAALETNRVNQFVPFTLTKTMSSGVDTTSQKLIFDQFDVGYIYIVTAITGIDVTDAAHQVRIGVTDGTTDLVFRSATVANAGDSVEFSGQLMLKETDKVYVEFRGAGASDVIRANMNGYKIRR